MTAFIKIITDSQFPQFNKEQLGKAGNHLAQLKRWSLTIAPSVIVPTSVFDHILVRSGKIGYLQRHLDQTQSLPIDKRKKQINQLLKSLSFPEDRFLEIQNLYKAYFKKNPVKVIASDPQFATTLKNIKNDEELIKGLMKVWQQSIIDLLTKNTSINHNWMAPSPVLIQQEIKPMWSGSISNRHPNALHKSALVVEYSQYPKHIFSNIQKSPVYTTQIDRRTATIISRDNHRKFINISHDKGYLELLLTKSLLPQAEKAFRQVLSPLQLSWLYDGQYFYWTDFSNSNLSNSPTSTSSIKPRTAQRATRAYVCVDNLHRSLSTLSHSDGIGLVDSNYLINQFGFHPIASLQQSKTKKFLKQNITNSLSELTQQTEAHNSLICYRLYNSTATERSKLKLSLNYENSNSLDSFYDTQPFHLKYPSWLEFELNAVQEVLTNYNGHKAIIIPSIDTPKNLAKSLTLISSSNFAQLAHPQFWLEVSSLALAINLSLFNLNFIQAISVNIDTILQSMLATSIENLHRHDLMISSSTHIIQAITQQLAQIPPSERPKIVLHSNIPNSNLVNTVVELGWYGVTTSPASLISTQALLVDAERKLLSKVY